jgi:hypothetical protein
VQLDQPVLQVLMDRVLQEQPVQRVQLVQPAQMVQQV